MKKWMMLLGLLSGLVLGCETEFDAVNQGPGPLPGDCNNPVVCDGTTHGGGGKNPGGGGSGGTVMCQGCECTSNIGACQHCDRACSLDKYDCDINGGSNCSEAYSQCKQDCGDTGQTCECPH
jgi:hypothetical protein